MWLNNQETYWSVVVSTVMPRSCTRTSLKAFLFGEGSRRAAEGLTEVKNKYQYKNHV